MYTLTTIYTTTHTQFLSFCRIFFPFFFSLFFFFLFSKTVGPLNSHSRFHGELRQQPRLFLRSAFSLIKEKTDISLLVAAAAAAKWHARFHLIEYCFLRIKPDYYYYLFLFFSFLFSRGV